jgi:hypothetical protein
MPTLISRAGLEDKLLRHHSGTPAYRKTFSMETVSADSRLLVDLGDVEVIASVSVNGKDCGIVWNNPYQVDVTAALKPGVPSNPAKTPSLSPPPSTAIDDHRSQPEQAARCRKDTHPGDIVNGGSSGRRIGISSTATPHETSTHSHRTRNPRVSHARQTA